MVDLQETPATPPFDPGGDERIGYFVSGATLLFLGWVLGVALNLLLHWEARMGPFQLWGVHFGPSLGPFAWAVFGLGLVTGALGAAILAVGRSATKGPFVLPGADY
ncbi:MAG: hypothetical protein L3K10_00965 [Thermoplasmata archaeon]|nr:hypothetical protein [Thermoplasmata archaeon]